MPEATQQLVDLDLNEISGVDYPANLHEGWIVLKSSDDPLDKAFTSAAEATLDIPDIGADTVELTHAEADIATDVVEKEAAVDADFRKQVTDLRKALDDAKAEAAAVKAERDLEKAVSRTADWANVPGVDADGFAPVLRSLRDAAPEQTAAIEAILDAVQTALTEQDVLTKELGSSAADEPGDAYSQMEALAKRLVDDGTAKNLADGIGQAAVARPDLYSDYIDTIGA